MSLYKMAKGKTIYVVGTPGPQGFQGSGQSSLGSQGLNGTQGVSGSIGAQGDMGSQGITGSGTQGAFGPQGPIGAGGTGTIGAQGDTGPQGIAGVGVQGNSGVGVQGATGIQGNNGFQGFTGPQGTVGFQGIIGSGTQGSSGSSGPQGNIGSQGVAGPQGNNGTGTTGSQGIAGTNGPQGTAGIVQNNGLFVATISGTITSAIVPTALTVTKSTGTNPPVYQSGTSKILFTLDGTYTMTYTIVAQKNASVTSGNLTSFIGINTTLSNSYAAGTRSVTNAQIDQTNNNTYFFITVSLTRFFTSGTSIAIYGYTDFNDGSSVTPINNSIVTIQYVNNGA